MKTTVTFLLATFLFVSTSLESLGQTIPNGDFEDWWTNTWTYSPVSWQTNNGQIQQDVFQDSASYEGVLAMQVRPTITSLGSEGLAWTEVDIDYIPASLDFHVKYQRTPTCGLSVEVIFYNDSVQVYSGYWWAEDTVSAWVPVHLELDQIEPIITHAVIRVGAFVGDFAPGDGWISVDAMSFGVVNDLAEEQIEISVFPNPTTDVLNVQIMNGIEVSRYSIYNVRGVLVKSDSYQTEVDVSTLDDGHYSLVLLSERRRLGQRQFVIRK